MLPEVLRDRYLSAAKPRALVTALDLDPCLDAAAALALLIVTGARKSEVLMATWDLVDLGRGMLAVLCSKNRMPRYILVSTVGNRHPAAAGGAAESRQPARRPEPEAARASPGESAAPRGLPEDLRIHDPRHSFASALANAGTPLYAIGTILGHRQIFHNDPVRAPSAEAAGGDGIHRGAGVEPAACANSRHG
jgi:integrase